MELQYLERRVHVNSVLGDTDLLALEIRGSLNLGPRLNRCSRFQSADQPLLDWDWTGVEEIKLLEAIEACGLGNWTDVAK